MKKWENFSLGCHMSRHSCSLLCHISTGEPGDVDNKTEVLKREKHADISAITLFMW